MNDYSPTYELKFEERPGYLYAQVQSDTMDRDIALAYLTQVADRCHRINSKRLLVERDVPVMLPAGDLFLVTKAFLEMIRTNIRVAFVNPYAPIEDDMNFAITIGTNRGGNYKLFADVPSAEHWLMQ